MSVNHTSALHLVIHCLTSAVQRPTACPSDLLLPHGSNISPHCQSFIPVLVESSLVLQPDISPEPPVSQADLRSRPSLGA